MNDLDPDNPARLGYVCSRIGRLRWGMWLGGCALFGWSASQHVELPWHGIWLVLVMLALVNLILTFALRRDFSPAWVLRIGLVTDQVCLTALLALSGGAANPLALLYLFPLILAALFAPGRFSWALTAFAIGAYGLLFFWRWPWPEEVIDPQAALTVHMTGMWLTLSLSALLIAGFVARVAQPSQRRSCTSARWRPGHKGGVRSSAKDAPQEGPEGSQETA
jgi:two-component system sensor histidine kinase RegB